MKGPGGKEGRREGEGKVEGWSNDQREKDIVEDEEERKRKIKEGGAKSK